MGTSTTSCWNRTATTWSASPRRATSRAGTPNTVSHLSTRNAVSVASLEPAVLKILLSKHPFDRFPCVKDGKLAGAAGPDARWLVSDFEVPASGAARLRARLVLALAYGFFRGAPRLPATRLIPPGPALIAAGFHRDRRRTFNAGLLRPNSGGVRSGPRLALWRALAEE